MAAHPMAAAGAALTLAPALALSAVLLMLGAAADPATGETCGAAGTPQTFAGGPLDAEQLGDALTIVQVTTGRGLPAYAATVALTAAYTEARLRNPSTPTDHDSIGLFQQRVSIYTAAVAANPVRATGAFLDRLLVLPDWQSASEGVDAQAVQRSAFPGRYQPNAALARQLMSQLWPGAAAQAAASTTEAAPPLCPGAGGASAAPGTGGNVAGTTTVPAGLVLTGSTAGQTAVRFALAQLGKPYRWGAAGPDAYDCSGLTLAAWATAGVAVPHLAAAQAAVGAPEAPDLSQAVGGDLVLIPGADGTAARPGHVGLVAGVVDAADGRHLYLVQAPATGLPVELTDAAAWAGQIVAVRHLG